MTHRGPFQPLLFCDSVIPHPRCLSCKRGSFGAFRVKRKMCCVGSAQPAAWSESGSGAEEQDGDEPAGQRRRQTWNNVGFYD